MENKINVAELLKDCPKGMELDCTMYEDVYFDYVDELNIIHCYIKNEGFKTSITFNQHGTPNSNIKSKCVIFPKGKTTWEGFIPPFDFKDGDILFCDANDDGDDDDSYKYVFILKEINENRIIAHCFICGYRFSFKETYLVDNTYPIRFATEEEKSKLFQAIKDYGYKWNEETKTLEKLTEPKFKVGDRIRKKGDYISGFITLIDSDNFYKVEYGDGCVSYVNVKAQDEWELVPNKFDISTLKPFDKVLVRDNNSQVWRISFFSHYNNLLVLQYSCINGSGYAQCVPYEENKHLLRTTNDCDDFYKNWI